MASRLAGLLLVLAALATPGTVAAAVSVRARLDPPHAQPGEPVELAVEITGTQNAPVPAIPAVDGITVSYVGPATQVSIVNGAISTSVTHRFSVVALRPGTFTIGPITIEHDGRQHDAGTVTLQAGAAPGTPPGARGQERREERGATGDQLRLVLSAPRSEVYLHERVPVSAKLYIGDVQVSDIHYPTLAGDGFALDKFAEPPEEHERTPQGVLRTFDFRTTLTPLRSGTLLVGPARTGLNLRVRQRSRDPFFGGFFGETSRPIEIVSEPLTLTVLPLPDAGRPADFSGAVGQFGLEVRAAPLDVAAGDPVTVTSTVRGRGNLTGATPPTIAASDALRVYPVQAATPAPPGTPEAEGGGRTFEQVVIPEKPGTLTLPPLRFSYFDPAARSYRTAVRPPITLTVRPAARPERTSPIVGAVPVAPPPEALGRDIVFIKDEPGALRATGTRLYRSAAFWAFQALPLSVWVVAVAWDRRRRRLSGDERYARFTRAGREARRAIAGARNALSTGQRSVFYDTVARAVSDYLSAKLHLPPGSVTPETVGDRVRGARLPAEVTIHVHEFFAACERARFSPNGASAGDMQDTLARADAIVRALERGRRLASRVAAVCIVLLGAGLAWADGEERPNTVFFRANSLYAEERDAEAAAEYERLLAGGHESGNVYFNLGNAYFKQGDVGRAILNYERARRLMPRDPDLHANLAYARTLAGEPGREPPYARLLFPLASRLSSDECLFAASLAYTALVALLLLARFVPAARRGAGRAAIATGAALVVLLTSAAYRLVTVDLRTQAVVVAGEETTVRFEPSPSGTAHFETKPGTVLHVLAQREGWAQVARADGRRGWIERAAIAEL